MNEFLCRYVSLFFFGFDLFWNFKLKIYIFSQSLRERERVEMERNNDATLAYLYVLPIRFILSSYSI